MKERLDEAEQFQSQKRNLMQHHAPLSPSSFVQGAEIKPEKARLSGSDHATVSRVTRTGNLPSASDLEKISYT